MVFGFCPIKLLVHGSNRSQLRFNEKVKVCRILGTVEMKSLTEDVPKSANFFKSQFVFYDNGMECLYLKPGA